MELSKCYRLFTCMGADALMKSGIEIQISTYNRKAILEKWIEKNYDKIVQLGIALAIYDSSTNDETSRLIEEINSQVERKIKYVRIDSDMRLDEKVLISMMQSEYSYVWPLGDSRAIDFVDIEKKVLPYVEKGCDFVCLWSSTLVDNDCKEYTEATEFFYDCFWHATWLGGLIIKKEILLGLNEPSVLDVYLKKYPRNDGFSYLGIFFDLIANKKISAFFVVVKIEEMSPNKTPGWLKRYLEVWCDNLCYLMDKMDNSYDFAKGKVVKEIWRTLCLDGPIWCYKARLMGGLDKSVFFCYEKEGYIDRVSEHKTRMKRFATLSRPALDVYFLVLTLQYYVKKVIKKIGKGGGKI